MRAYNTYMHKSGFGQNPDEDYSRHYFDVQYIMSRKHNTWYEMYV